MKQLSLDVAPLLARLESQIQREGDCWIWTGNRTEKGYGRASIQGKRWRVHRFTYLLLAGPIPDGLELDHLCRNTACVNPAHLEPVTVQENIRRGYNATKTHCLRGHEFNAENTRLDRDGHRYCRQCNAERKRRPRGRPRLDTYRYPTPTQAPLVSAGSERGLRPHLARVLSEVSQ